MQRAIPIVLASVLFPLCCVLEASTPNTPRPWDDDKFPADGASPLEVTQHMKCVITEVRDDRIVQIWDKFSRQRHLVRIAEEVPIEARRKKDFDGRESLDFADLRAGHRVKLTYRASDGTITGIKVIDRVDTLP